MNEDISKPESSNHTGRKRSRSENEDTEECLPIAKRINNLQIRSRECSSDGFIQESVHGHVQNNWDRDLVTSHLKENGFHSQLSSSASNSDNNNTMYLGDINQPVPGGSLQAEAQILDQRLDSNGAAPIQLKNLLDEFRNDVEMEPYEPELDDSTNPHYYSINQLLYYANFARQTRTRNGFKQ